MYAGLMLIGMIVFFFLVLPPAFKQFTKGKVFCLFIEDDGYVNGMLKKPRYNGEYIIEGDGAYDIVPSRVGLTTFPKGLLPAWFTTVVPCLIFRRDDPIPQIIENPGALKFTAKEVKIALEPHFLKALADKSKEGIQSDKREKILLMIAAGGAVVAVLILLFLLSKMGNVPVTP